MKKLLLMILPAFICAGSLFAQTSTVSGVWERGKTKAVKMFKIVEGGNLSEVATSALGEDGSFQMTFTPEHICISCWVLPLRYFRIVIHFI